MRQFRARPTSLAKNLRNNATDAERLLWNHLSRRQLGGYKFSRQMPVAGYVCDFLCREAGLVIEVDGGQHALNVRRDALRTEALEREGYRVIRFWNNEVLENTEAVLATILQALSSGPPPPPPPPAGGRGV